MAVSDVSGSGCKPCLGGPSYQASVLLNLDAVMCCAAVCHHKYMEMPSCWPLRVHSSRLIPPSGPARPAFAFLPCLMHVALEPDAAQCAKKLFTLLDLCVSSLRRGHAIESVSVRNCQKTIRNVRKTIRKQSEKK